MDLTMRSTFLVALLNLMVIEALSFSLVVLPLTTTNRRSSLRAATVSVSVPNRLSREEGLSVVNTCLLSLDEYWARVTTAKDAQGFAASTLILGDDPRLCFSYGEFPTHSTDALIDLALTHIPPIEGTIEMLDLGSGCGRLVCYFALTRGTLEQPWSVQGLEICSALMEVASRAVIVGVKKQLFVENDGMGMGGQNTIALHLGAAENLTNVIAQADLIFAYCTTFKTDGFSEELGAMILDQQWSELLANLCRKGCVVITTDRVLDPRDGWQLLDRLDVDNREVMGSTGYIQVLR
jgi:hypothetical protein